MKIFSLSGKRRIPKAREIDKGKKKVRGKERKETRYKIRISKGRKKKKNE